MCKRENSSVNGAHRGNYMLFEWDKNAEFKKTCRFKSRHPEKKTKKKTLNKVFN